MPTSEVSSETEEGIISGRTACGEDRSSRPCSRTENASAFVTSEGFLDLSNIGLTALSADFQQEYSITKDLDVSKNKMKTCNLSYFNICRKINISENNFTTLSSLLPSYRKLDTIVACDNEIRITNKIQDFIALSSLHLCRNSIKSFPSLKFNRLQFLDLSDNMLSEFPDLSYMPHLDTLLLANNQIVSLSHPMQCKSNIKVLDLSGNPISNLSEVYHLEKMKEIANFAIKNAPCLSSFEEYHYKSFLIVLFPSVRFINDMDVVEIESFNAEFLTLRGNLTGLHSKFSAAMGSNDSLSTYLKEQSVLLDESGKMPKDKKLFKMMLARSQMHKAVPEDKRAMSASISKTSRSTHDRKVKENRRKSFAACKTSFKPSDNDTTEFMTTDDDLSVHSPFGNYIAQLGKENHCPQRMEKKNILENTSPLKTSIETRNGDYFQSSDDSTSRTTPIGLSSSQSSRLVMSPEYQSSEEVTVGTLTPTRKSSTPQYQQKAKVLDATFTREEKEELNQMKGVIDDLYDSNIKLYMVQDIISETMKQLDDKNKEKMNELQKSNGLLEERCRNLEERIASLEMKAKGPTPIIQRAVRNLNDEEIGLNWQASFVKGYNLIMDGSLIGTVKGTSAKVTDVSSESHRLQIQTVLLDGSLGELSEEILIREAEEKV